MKDLFSAQAGLYAQYRPVYPQDLYDFILEQVLRKDAALDCATGNGQVARALSSRFRNVRAIDISENQLRHAPCLPNVEYSVHPAEHTPFDDDSFDLITVAQAYHWLDGQKFSREARRVGRSGAVVAVWGYDIPTSDSTVDSIVRRWNFEMLAPYWEPERHHLYKHFEDQPFEFEPITAPGFRIVVDWGKEELVGNLKTWSALQRMVREVGEGAFNEVVGKIKAVWDDGQKKRFTYPVFVKLGRVTK